MNLLIKKMKSKGTVISLLAMKTHHKDIAIKKRKTVA